MATVLQYGKQMLRLAALSLSLLVVVPRLAQGRIPPVPGDQLHESTFGDIKMSLYHNADIDREGNVEATGPNILVESLDPKKPVQFVVHADRATGHRVKTGKQVTAVADLQGNIRYKITQNTKAGVQIIEGTAGHADYDQAAARLHLTQGVHATLTNEAQLEGPAPLRAESVTVYTGDSKTKDIERFDIAGTPASNDIQLVLRRKPAVKDNDKKPAKPLAGIPVHLHGFRTGEVAVGKSAVIIGPGSTADFSDPSQGSQSTLSGDRITTEFGKIPPHTNAGDDVVVTRANASGDVRFRSERTDKDGNRQSVTGHAADAAYDAEQNTLTLTGGVAADIADPTRLLEPAHVTGSKLIAHIIAPLRYTISGPAEHNSLVFRLRPEEKKPGTTTSAASSRAKDGKTESSDLKSFAVGIVHIDGFDTGTFEPGKEIVLAGDKTTYRSSDEQTHTSSLLRSSKLTAIVAEDQTLKQILAIGNVRMEIRQPYPSGKGTQVTRGTATRATLTNAKSEETIDVPGPFQFNRTLEDSPEPSILVGEAGDSLTYNVTSGKWHVEVPDSNSTFTLPANASTSAAKGATGGAAQPAKERKQ